MSSENKPVITFDIATFILGIIAQGLKLLTQLRETARKTGEWTEQQEKQFDDNLARVQAGEDPVWTVEPDPTDEAPMN